MVRSSSSFAHCSTDNFANKYNCVQRYLGNQMKDTNVITFVDTVPLLYNLQWEIVFHTAMV